MASLNIRPYVDQENASTQGLRGRLKSHGPASTPVGKTFQGNSELKKSLVTPRKALGDVNRQDVFHSINRNDKKSLKDFKQPAKKTPALKLQPNATNQQRTQIAHKPPETNILAQNSVPLAAVEDDIENMPIVKEIEDDFEDILPIAERPSTFIGELLQWRPSSLYSFWNRDSDNDEEDRLSIRSEEFSPLTEYDADTTNDTDTDLLLPEPNIEDIQLPPLEISDLDLFANF